MTNSDINSLTVDAEDEPHILTHGVHPRAPEEENSGTSEGDASDEQGGSVGHGPRRKRRRIQVQDHDGSDISDTHEVCTLSDNGEDEDEDELETHLERDLRNIAAQREQTVATIDAGESGNDTDGEDFAYVTGSARETISVDEEAKLQQVVEISNDEEEEKEDTKESTDVVEHKRAVDYRCPICFDPPEAALMTPCGHIFCTVCLFQMVNSSRGYRRNGQCALCRKDVKLKEVGLVILRKKRVKKET